MGWRDTQAKIESGELNYRRPAKNNFDVFADSFAGSFEKSFSDRQAAKRAETRYQRGRADTLSDEERTDAKRIAREAEGIRNAKNASTLAAAKEAEKVEAARRRNATKLLIENGKDANNPNFLQFAMDHMESYGDKYADASSSFVELLPRITELGPAQGPLMRRSDIDLDTSFESTSRAYSNKDSLGDAERDSLENTVDGITGGDPLTSTNFGSAMGQQMDDLLGSTEATGVRSALRSGESNNKIDAVDFNDDGRDHVGLYQFGQARLDDYNSENNTSHTTESLKKMPAEEQERIADWHFDNIDSFIDSNGLDKYVGQTMAGVQITRSGMIAMAHLGGNSGMQRFLESNGRENPDDSSSTVKGNSLADYAGKFGGEEANTSRSASGEDDPSDYPSFDISAKKSDIDWSNTSSEDLDNYLALHNSGAKPLSPVDFQKAKDLQEEFATSEIPNIAINYLGAGSPAAITAAVSQVENDSRLPDDRKAAVIASLTANRDEMVAAAAAQRNATKNANKTPEVMALEALQATEAFTKLTAGEQAAMTVNFGSIFKPTYSSVEEAIAAYNTANSLGEGYESQVSKIEAIINKAYGGNSERVFAVDPEGFGRVYFVSKAFDPETNSVVSTTASGDSLPTNIIPMADYDATDVRSERKAIESDLAKYNKSVASFLTLSSSMADIVDIAKQNDGVLTWTAKTMKNIATVTGEVDTFMSVLNDMGPNRDGMITRESYEKQLKAKGLLGKNETLDTLTLDATPPTTLTSWVFGGKDNQLIAARRALEAKLALAPFKVGNAEGTTGTAMSNQDRDLFMKFLTVFRGADGLEKNFVEYLRTSRDELDTVVQRFLPGSAEFESFKDSYGYYPGKGFAKTLEEYVEDHPNTEKFSQILSGLSTGSLSTQNNTAPPVITLEKFRSDFLKLNPVINMTKEIEDIILKNYNLKHGGTK